LRVEYTALWRSLHRTANQKEDAMDINAVLEEYRKGDDGKRLSLFLAFRELRDHFDRIEQQDPLDDFVVIQFPWTRKHEKHELKKAA
jgi:hypothetical protein